VQVQVQVLVASIVLLRNPSMVSIGFWL
jgi:hypothetical protein